jgi:hypothetical protein
LERLKRKCIKIQLEGAILFTKLRKVIRFYKFFCKGCKILQKGVLAKVRLGMHSR